MTKDTPSKSRQKWFSVLPHSPGLIFGLGMRLDQPGIKLLQLNASYIIIHVIWSLYTSIFPGFIDQEKDAAPVWWLESSSYPIEILDKKVRVLVRSDELKRRYKHDAVIISFEWGKGVVYHMISHFYLQRSETRTKKQGMGGRASLLHAHITIRLLA